MTTASRARFTLLRFTLVLSVITYLDRVAISSAAPAIRDELQPERSADGMGVQRVHVCVCGVRDSERMAGRCLWPAQGPGAHRPVVVGVHDGHRAGLEFRVRWSSRVFSSASEKPAPFRISRGASPAGFPRRNAEMRTASFSWARGLAARWRRRWSCCS